MTTEVCEDGLGDIKIMVEGEELKPPVIKPRTHCLRQLGQQTDVEWTQGGFRREADVVENNSKCSQCARARYRCSNSRISISTSNRINGRASPAGEPVLGSS